MHVHANAATSVDGKLATVERVQTALSGPRDFDRVDRLRAGVDAVLVGVGTVLADDPSLTHGDGDEPARVVLDSRGRTPPGARVLDGSAPTYVLVAADCPPERRRTLEAADARVLPTAGEGRVDVVDGLDRLGDEGIDRVLVEGGGEVLYSMFEADLVDVLSVFISPHLVGGRDAPTLVDGEGFVERFPRLALRAVERLDGGLLCLYDVDGWAPAPTAGQSSD